MMSTEKFPTRCPRNVSLVTGCIVSQKSHVEVTTPNAFESDLIWKQGHN
jgi:hypothetical protein